MPDPRVSGPVTLAMRNARVLTMNSACPRAEAVAIAGNRIRAAGTDREIHALANPQTVDVDCGGRLLVPGFIDAHAHVLGTAARLSGVDCKGATSIGTLIEAIRRARPANGWIRVFGYHELLLREKRHPTRGELDRATPIPVRLTHASGHASVLNSAGLRALGIDETAREPRGGTIERDAATGAPNGLLIEMEDTLDAAMPRASTAEVDQSVRALSEQFLRAGVTSVQDLGHRNDRRRAERMAAMRNTGAFRPRLSMATGYDAFEAGEDAVAEGIGVGPVKILLNETGEVVLPEPFELARRVALVHAAGRQVAIHAIEARAIEMALDAIATAQSSDGGRRHRIEHASLTPPRTRERIAGLGVIAVSNPSLLRQNGDRYLTSIAAADLDSLYDVAGLLQVGAAVAAGSDCPIGPIEPLAGIAAVCERRTESGKPIPGRTLPLARALELFTCCAAMAAYEEQEKGHIAAGLLADLIVLDDKAFPLDVWMTVLGGEIVAR
jgi:predicted amidohydrolase YtcJ